MLGMSTPKRVQSEIASTICRDVVAPVLSPSLMRETNSRPKLGLAASRAPEATRVQITDTGAGISAEHLPKIWDRFYRADDARTTTAGHIGLGLALVKSIATLHGGTVEAASEPGKGTRVRLLLPG